MVKPSATYVAQKRLLWYGHVMRREDTNVAKQVAMMKVGGKIPRAAGFFLFLSDTSSFVGHILRLCGHLCRTHLAADTSGYAGHI